MPSVDFLFGNEFVCAVFAFLFSSLNLNTDRHTCRYNGVRAYTEILVDQRNVWPGQSIEITGMRNPNENCFEKIYTFFTQKHRKWKISEICSKLEKYQKFNHIVEGLYQLSLQKSFFVKFSLNIFIYFGRNIASSLDRISEDNLIELFNYRNMRNLEN